MKKDFKELIKKYFLVIKNNKRIALIFIIGLGLILLPTEKQDTKKESQTLSNESFIDYKTQLEQELTQILSQIKGAGKVSVMITLDDDGSTYFAVDETESFAESGEEKNTERQTQHVLKNAGSNTDEPLITKKVHPQISGVLICAQGASDASVKNNITSAVEALLGVKSHRVEVLERN